MITKLTVQHNSTSNNNNRSRNSKDIARSNNNCPTTAAGDPQVAVQQQARELKMAHYHSLSPTQVDQLSESISSSSLSNTDSDSLMSVPQQQQQQQNMSLKNTNPDNTTAINNPNDDNSNIGNPNSASKSPISIKYNYYDYSGMRQEQSNHDMNHYQTSNGQAKIQKNLSPTFKQNLDQIVRNSQMQLKQANNNNNNSSNNNNNNNSSPSISTTPPSSPEYHQQMIHFARRYKLSSYEQRCLRCNKTVYQMDKVGPLKDFTFYHQNCFKCRECGTKLTLKTYFNNQQSSEDHEVYCHRHCPKTGPGKLDNQSVGIRAALNAPKVFDVVLQTGHVINNSSTNNHEQINGHLSPTNKGYLLNNNNNQQQDISSPNHIDSNALYIQHAVQQTRLQNIYKQSQVDKKISQFINKRLEFLEPKQKMLEMRHREEEDALFKTFEQKWRQEESSISEQIRQEWQIELNKLLEKYKRQLSSISTNHHQQQQLISARVKDINSPSSINTQSNNHQQQQLPSNQAVISESTDGKVKLTTSGKNLLLKQLSDPNSVELSKQQMIEFERLNLEKTMTIKLDKKKETLKRKLKEFERQATAELVEKQSREMLALISMKLDEYKEEQKRKIGSDLEQFEAIESLANQLGSSLQLQSAANVKSTGNPKTSYNNNNNNISPPLLRTTNNYVPNNKQLEHQQWSSTSGPLEAPPPKPPQVSKMELYNSEEPDEVFRDIDQLAINVAKEDQQTFTDLVHHLTRHCLTDIEKVRAIFRWITVKNLNTMHFDSSVKPDTPLGLLRGIKNGSESYHVLFKRLCSYAGLHCVVIKGYSKSAGYQPGVKFEGNRFRNSWNAVYVAGAWRFVQCNWGARHLVSVAVMQDKNNQTPNNNKSLSGPQQQGSQQLDQAPEISAPPKQAHAASVITTGRSQQQVLLTSPNRGRRGLAPSVNGSNNGSAILNNPSTGGGGGVAQFDSVPVLHHHHQQQQQAYDNSFIISKHALSHSASPPSSSSSSTTSSSPTALKSIGNGNQHNHNHHHHHHHHHNHRNDQQINYQDHQSQAPTKPYKSIQQQQNPKISQYPASKSLTVTNSVKSSNDSLRYEYDDHYFLTDPDEFIYEFYPLLAEWQLIKTRPITLSEFEQLPFVRSLFFKYGLYFPQNDIRSVLYTDTSGATTIKIGMPTHMIPSLIFHYNLKYYNSDLENFEGVSLKRFVMQSVESGTGDNSGGQVLLSNIVTFRVHLPENGAYILDIFANSTTPTQYITGEPMKFKSVCKFKIIAKNLKTCMIPLPDCASGEYGPMKATRLFGIIPITHESGLIVVQNDKRFLEIQFRMTRPLLDFMASLHKNGYDERQLSKSIKIFIDGDIVFVTVKFFEDGQYGLDIYTRDKMIGSSSSSSSSPLSPTSSSSLSSSSSTSPISPLIVGGLNNKPDRYPPATPIGISKSDSQVQARSHAEPKKQLLTHCCKYLINVRTPNNR